jgi:hypothetical protein
MYQPLHKFAEALPLVLQGVQLDGLVACPAQPLYLLRRAFTQALQRLDIAPGVLEPDPDAILAEAAVGPVAARVRGDHDRSGGHRLEPRHVEAFLDERRREKDLRPVIELPQFLPPDGLPYRPELEMPVAREYPRYLISHSALPGGIADLDRVAETAPSLLREEARLVAEQDHLAHRGGVQVRLDRLEDHVVRHDAGHRAREEAQGVAARE